MKPADYSTREEYIKDLIVNAMMDDYESFEIIVRCVKEEDETVKAMEVQSLLRELIEGGRIRAYDLHVSQREPVPYSHDRVRELWFYPTPQERTAHMERHNIKG